MQDFWQSPGNKQIFDSILNLNPKKFSTSTLYTFSTLSYFKNNVDASGFKLKYINLLKVLIFKQMNKPENKTVAIHLITHLVFYGFLKIIKK
ncbi:hypothetical protein ACXYRO_00925 [Mycoplasma sp. 4013]